MAQLLERIDEPKDQAGRGVYTIAKAQEEARRLQALIDQGKDPRREVLAQVAEHEALRITARADRQRLEITGLEAWTAYCDDRRPFWGARHLADHLSFVSAGGVQRKRAEGKTIPGPLRRLLAGPLASMTLEVIDT